MKSCNNCYKKYICKDTTNVCENWKIMPKSCFSCEYAHIYEESHEWLQCKCEYAHKTVSPSDCKFGLTVDC